MSVLASASRNLFVKTSISLTLDRASIDVLVLVLVRLRRYTQLKLYFTNVWSGRYAWHESLTFKSLLKLFLVWGRDNLIIEAISVHGCSEEEAEFEGVLPGVLSVYTASVTSGLSFSLGELDVVFMFDPNIPSQDSVEKL